MFLGPVHGEEDRCVVASVGLRDRVATSGEDVSFLQLDGELGVGFEGRLWCDGRDGPAAQHGQVRAGDGGVAGAVDPRRAH